MSSSGEGRTTVLSLTLNRPSLRRGTGLSIKVLRESRWSITLLTIISIRQVLLFTAWRGQGEKSRLSGPMPWSRKSSCLGKNCLGLSL